MTLFSWIDETIQKQSKVIIAIDGPSGSGKSTLAQSIKEKYNATVIHMDDYFIPEHKKADIPKVPGWNLDYPRFEEEVITSLSKNQITSNHFNCKTQQLEYRDSLQLSSVVVIEGVYSTHPSLRHNYDCCVYISITNEEQIKRIEQRNGPSMLSRWILEWIPLENEYFNYFNIKNNADIVL